MMASSAPFNGKTTRGTRVKTRARHVPPKVTRKNSGPEFIKKILSQPLFRGPSALTHSTTGLQSGCAAPTQDSHVKHA